MTFENSWYFLLLIVLVPLIWLRMRLRKNSATVRFPSKTFLASLPVSLRAVCANWLWVLRVIVLVLLVIAIAAPRRGIQTVHDMTKGVDIVLCIDVSGSMRDTDLDKNQQRSRLEIVKEVAANFVDMRKHDRIAVVPFAKYAIRLCPLTLNTEWTKAQIARLTLRPIDRFGRPVGEPPAGAVMLDESKTAIGSAIATSALALKNSEAKSKVVILLTDGESNFGKLGPLEAAEIARRVDVRIYTIGAGRDKIQRGFFSSHRVNPIDEETLKEVAKRTNGKYFRAQDKNGLARIYEEIDRLEKTEVESLTHTRYRQYFTYLAMPALLLLFLELALGLTILRKTP